MTARSTLSEEVETSSESVSHRNPNNKIYAICKKFSISESELLQHFEVKALPVRLVRAVTEWQKRGGVDWPDFKTETTTNREQRWKKSKAKARVSIDRFQPKDIKRQSKEQKGTRRDTA